MCRTGHKLELMVGEYHNADTAAITTTSFNGICQDSLGKPAPQR